MVLYERQIIQLQELLQTSLDRLYENDSTLIERRGLERSIGFRIGLYLNERAPEIGWKNHLTIDLEYN